MFKIFLNKRCVNHFSFLSGFILIIVIVIIVIDLLSVKNTCVYINILFDFGVYSIRLKFIDIWAI